MNKQTRWLPTSGTERNWEKKTNYETCGDVWKQTLCLTRMNEDGVFERKIVKWDPGDKEVTRWGISKDEKL